MKFREIQFAIWLLSKKLNLLKEPNKKFEFKTPSFETSPRPLFLLENLPFDRLIKLIKGCIRMILIDQAVEIEELLEQLNRFIGWK